MTHAQLQLKLLNENDPEPTLPPLKNAFGTGINVYTFGKGFPWQSKVHYQDWHGAVPLLLPYLEHFGLGQAVVPDFRGRNAYLGGFDQDELLPMHINPARLWRTARHIDGIALKPKRSVFSISADCYTVILIDTLKQRALALHCGRDALHPLRREDGSIRVQKRPSIIDAAMEHMMPTNVQMIYGLILCGIGPKWYENRPDHDTTGFHKRVVEYFVEKCGRGAVDGDLAVGQLNIPHIIRAQLSEWRVDAFDRKRFLWDGIDTFTDDRFHSRRKSPDGNNCVLIDMERAFA